MSYFDEIISEQDQRHTRIAIQTLNRFAAEIVYFLRQLPVR